MTDFGPDVDGDIDEVMEDPRPDANRHAADQEGEFLQQKNRSRDRKRKLKATKAAPQDTTAHSSDSDHAIRPATKRPAQPATQTATPTPTAVASSATTPAQATTPPTPTPTPDTTVHHTSIPTTVVHPTMATQPNPPSSLHPSQPPTGTAPTQPTTQPQQQQASQPQNDKRKLARPAPATAAQLQQCGVSPDSTTSFVLILTPLAGQQTNDVQHWNKQPRLSDSDSRAQQAAALLLNRLNLPPPATPKLFNRLSTVDELLAALQQLASSKPAETDALAAAAADLTTAVGKDRDGKTTQHTAAALHGLAATLRQRKADACVASGWVGLLTPRTGCLSRTSDRSQDTTTRPRAPRTTPARCLLRLDFPTPLSSLFAQHHLRHIHDAAIAPTDTDTTQPPRPPTNPSRLPKADIDVQPYKLRLTITEVSGFAIGPINPGAHPACTSPSEPHGNWQLLRQYLQRVAPNCTPSIHYRRLPSGVAAVRFALEETHRHELYALTTNRAVDPEHGITRPLRLRMEVPRLPDVTACSSCGKAGHSATKCTTIPQGNGKTCRRCFALGHTATDCTKATEQLTCGICQQPGHSTTSCKRYCPQWTKVVVKQPSVVRNTLSYAAATIATMRGIPVSQPVTPSPTASTSHGSPPLPQQAKHTPHPPTHPTHSPPPATHPAISALEQQMTMLTNLFTTMQQTMQRQAEEARELARQQQVWMERLFSMLLQNQVQFKPAPLYDDHHDTARQYTPSPHHSPTTPPPAASVSDQPPNQPHATTPPVLAEDTHAHGTQPLAAPSQALTGASRPHASAAPTHTSEPPYHNHGIHIVNSPIQHITNPPPATSGQGSTTQAPPSYPSTQ